MIWDARQGPSLQSGGLVEAGTYQFWPAVARPLSVAP